MQPVTRRLTPFYSRCLCSLLTSVALIASVAQADSPTWQKIAYKTPATPSLHNLAQRHYALLDHFLTDALQGQGKTDFLHVTAQTKNNIQWHNEHGVNAYNEAFRRSHEFVKTVDLQGMPDTVLLIPYMESQWHGTRGKKSADYGYWQLVPEVLREIQTLDYLPTPVREGDIDTVRTDATLSTQAALAHLHRYYFYFAKVAKFSDSEAWLMTFIAFNWGAGNCKRLIATMQTKGEAVNFSNFYHELYLIQQQQPGDKSLRAAVEYVPSLWNIARLLKSTN